jgi:hypothetical protein
MVTEVSHIFLRLLHRVNDRDALSVGKELHVLLSSQSGAFVDDLARRLLEPLLVNHLGNQKKLSRVVDLMPAALASTSIRHRDELLKEIFKVNWTPSLLLPMASGLVDLQDMLLSSSTMGLESSHWVALRIKILNHLRCNNFEAADYAGVIRLLLRLLLRLDQNDWFEVVRQILYSLTHLLTHSLTQNINNFRYVRR